MKLEFDIPDELIGTFKRFNKTITEVVEKAEETINKEFNSEGFKNNTKELFNEISKTLKDIEQEVKPTNFEEILDMFFNIKEQEQEQEQELVEPHSELVYRKLNKMLEEIEKIDSTNIGWLKALITTRDKNMEFTDDFIKKDTKNSTILTSLFLFNKSPQGQFYWKSIVSELKEGGE